MIIRIPGRESSLAPTPVPADAHALTVVRTPPHGPAQEFTTQAFPDDPRGSVEQIIGEIEAGGYHAGGQAVRAILRILNTAGDVVGEVDLHEFGGWWAVRRLELRLIHFFSGDVEHAAATLAEENQALWAELDRLTQQRKKVKAVFEWARGRVLELRALRNERTGAESEGFDRAAAEVGHLADRVAGAIGLDTHTGHFQ